MVIHLGHAMKSLIQLLKRQLESQIGDGDGLKKPLIKQLIIKIHSSYQMVALFVVEYGFPRKMICNQAQLITLTK